MVLPLPRSIGTRIQERHQDAITTIPMKTALYSSLPLSLRQLNDILKGDLDGVFPPGPRQAPLPARYSRQ
jgi:hypothetical protein